MQERDIISAVAVKIGSSNANAEEIAGAYVKMAVLKVGRTRGVSWNREGVAFTLTSGKASYKIGQEILKDYPDLRNLQSIHFTDAPDNPVDLVGVDEFSKFARGSSASGRPEKACLHSGETTLEFWPNPASAYATWAYLRKKIENFSDIPEDYHDVVFAVAMAMLTSPSAFAAQGIKEIKEDSYTTWEGNVFQVSRGIGGASGGGADSGNLRGR